MNENCNSNAAGSSLFTTEHSVFVPNNEQQDDEEDLEDQMRRQEELQNLIANAFDDFEYEDEHSKVNSSFDSNCSRNKSNMQGSGDNFSFTDNNYKNTSLNSFEQLQVLYQVRVQESQKLMKEIDILKEQFKQEKDQMTKKLMLLEADNNRINISLQQSQDLLVEKTEIINKQTKDLEKMKEFVENLQSSNEKFEEEVLFWKSNSNELEQKLHLMEKGINKSISEKQIRAHYEQEINKLQELLQSTNSNLDKAERENHVLETQIQEVEHDKELALAEKAKVINTITKNLEDSQSQNFSLMNKLTVLQQEKNALETELHTKDTTVKHNLTTRNYEEVIETLKDELYRSLEEQKNKQREIEHLEEMLNEFRQKEKKYHEEIYNKQSKEKLENEDLKKEKNNMYNVINNLQLKIKELEDRNKMEVEHTSLNSSHSSINSEKHKQKREEYDKLKCELDKIQKQITDSLNLKDRYIVCEQQCLSLQENVADLNSKLSDAQIMIATLKEKLALKEERDNLIETLKKKAEMFEEYMATKQDIITKNTSVNTSYYTLDTIEQAIQTDEISEQQMNIYMKQLNELEKIVGKQTDQMKFLFEENNKLKERITLDRNQFTELVGRLSQETKNLNKTLQLTVEKNGVLVKNIDVLKKEITEKQLLCDMLNSKIEQAKEYINLMEITSTRQNKHVVSEHEQVKAKYANLLEIVQARLNRCIDVTKSNMMY